MIDDKAYNFQSLITNYGLDKRFDVRCFVYQFVEKTIANVMKIISGMDDISTEELRNATVTRSLSRYGIEWPTCGNVGIRRALNSIKNEMKEWNNLPELKDWMFHVEFTNLSAEESIKFYKFEVTWSVPTAAYPEPQVTVSVFFTVTANLDYPPHYPVDVTYTFEAHQFAHRLDTIFQPKWLYDVLDLKTIMFKSFKF